MDSTLSIRPALREEIPLLREMSVVTCEDTFGPFNPRAVMDAYVGEAFSLSQFEKEFSEKDACYYLLCEGVEAIGFMRTRITDEVKHLLGDNTLELQRIYLLPAHKGKRGGSLMLAHAIALATEQQRDWLWLGVWERNFPAQRFYAKNGFERFSEHVFMMGDDAQTDWLLRLRIPLAAVSVS